MDEEQLTEARRRAEQAVADMADGPLKVKAFEVILSTLLAHRDAPAPARKARQTSPSLRSRKKTRFPAPAATLTGRIQSLRHEGFFRAQRTLGAVREELTSHGWHYPLTTLSGIMQGLVRKRELRRQRVKTATKTVWMYSNI